MFFVLTQNNLLKSLLHMSLEKKVLIIFSRKYFCPRLPWKRCCSSIRLKLGVCTSSQNTAISVYINHNNLFTKTSQDNSALSYNACMIKFHKCLSVKTLSRKGRGTFDRQQRKRITVLFYNFKDNSFCDLED